MLADALDHELILQAAPAIERGEHVSIEAKVRNVNRCVGGMLSSSASVRVAPICFSVPTPAASVASRLAEGVNRSIS